MISCAMARKDPETIGREAVKTCAALGEGRGRNRLASIGGLVRCAYEIVTEEHPPFHRMEGDRLDKSIRASAEATVRRRGRRR